MRYTVEPVHGKSLSQHRNRGGKGVPLAPWLNFGRLSEDAQSAQLASCLRKHYVRKAPRIASRQAEKRL